MAVNVPTYDTDRFTFGPGILYLDALVQPASTSGVSDRVFNNNDSTMTDVGGVRSGGTFGVTRTKLEVNQGSPITLVKQFVTQESANMTVNGIEWDLNSIVLALGAGTTATDTAGDPLNGAAADSPPATTNGRSFGFGGDLNVTECAVKLIHKTPAGHTLTIRMWRAQGSGEMSVTFGDDLHEVPYSFDALEAGSSSWQNIKVGSSTIAAGLALSSSENLFNITYETGD